MIYMARIWSGNLGHFFCTWVYFEKRPRPIDRLTHIKVFCSNVFFFSKLRILSLLHGNDTYIVFQMKKKTSYVFFLCVKYKTDFNLINDSFNFFIWKNIGLGLYSWCYITLWRKVSEKKGLNVYKHFFRL